MDNLIEVRNEYVEHIQDILCVVISKRINKILIDEQHMYELLKDVDDSNNKELEKIDEEDEDAEDYDNFNGCIEKGLNINFKKDNKINNICYKLPEQKIKIV